LFSVTYPKELRLNKTNESNILMTFLDLYLSVNGEFLSIKIYDKRDNCDFGIVNYLHLDGDVPRATSYGVYITHFILFTRAYFSREYLTIGNRTITETTVLQTQ